MNRVKRLAVIIMTATMLLGTMLTATGCTRKTLEVNGWTLFRYYHHSLKRRLVNVVSANNDSLVVDGVLTIPAKIGRHNIFDFGRPGQGMFGSDRGADFWINEDLIKSIERIAVAEEILVGESFYGNFEQIFGYGATVYVELLSETFENIRNFLGGVDLYVYVVFIIPDGSTQNFIATHPNALLYQVNFIEKSKYLEEKQND